MTTPNENQDPTPEDRKAYIEAFLRPAESRQDRTRWLTLGWPERPAQVVAGLMGLPVEKRARPISHPIAILSFLTILLIVHLLTSSDRELAVMNWGLIPSQIHRHFFLTLITSFFLHGNLLHLLSNAYYFFIFGDDVENDMSGSHFIRLLLGSHLAGALAHVLLGGMSDLPMVGASGGISGLMGYYMIRFPRRQISYMILFFYVWLHLPVFAAFLWKFSWEFLIASSQQPLLQGGVAHWAHLGGAAFGAFIAYSKLQTLRNQPS